MKRIRLLISIVAVGLALVPLSAAAGTAYTETVRGVETGLPQSPASCPAPNSVSSFAGLATGTLNGGFVISVCHTALGPRGATILGGAFVISNGATTVRGAFAPGGVVFPPSLQVNGSLCIQRYVVSGGLPSGHFGGKLTHYGFWTGSSCDVFFATISGNATLTA